MNWNRILPGRTSLLISSLSVDEIQDRLLQQLPCEYGVNPFYIFGRCRIQSSVQHGSIIIQDVIPGPKTVGTAAISTQDGKSLICINYIADNRAVSVFLGLYFVCFLVEIWLPANARIFPRNLSVMSLPVFIFVTLFFALPAALYIRFAVVYDKIARTRAKGIGM